jgi:predicted transcriptional regulator
VEEAGFTSELLTFHAFRLSSLVVFLWQNIGGRLKIIADILNATDSVAKKTKIMYIANLSHKLLEKYLEESIKIDFIRFNNEGYEVTEKGLAFLEKYNDFSGRYSRVEKELQNMIFKKEILERMCNPPEKNSTKPIVNKRVQA